MKKSIRQFRVAIILTLSWLVFSCTQNDPKPASIQETLDNIVSPYIVLGADVGILVGTIHNGEKTIYSFGERGIGSKEKMTGQSVLEIASLTKTYTALALADMHLKGDLNLDDPIEKYLPNTVRVPSYEGKKITLRHLANHTSGFPRFASNADQDVYNEYEGYTEQKMYEFISSYTLPREPGTEFEYSAVGYGLLGEILSLKNNSNYEAMMMSRVLLPLNMMHTTISFTPDQLQNLAHGHNGNKVVESWSQHMQNIVQGTGALISTLDDQLFYLEANMGITSTPLYDAMKLSHELTFQHTKMYTDGTGLGWNLFTIQGEHIIWKNGGNGGYNSFMGFNEEKQTGVVILINSSLNPEIFATDMGFEILKVLNRF